MHSPSDYIGNPLDILLLLGFILRYGCYLQVLEVEVEVELDLLYQYLGKFGQQKVPDVPTMVYKLPY